MKKLTRVHTENLLGIYEDFKNFIHDKFEDLQKNPSKWEEFNHDYTSESYILEDGFKLERSWLYKEECDRFNAAVSALGR